MDFRPLLADLDAAFEVGCTVNLEECFSSGGPYIGFPAARIFGFPYGRFSGHPLCIFPSPSIAVASAVSQGERSEHEIPIFTLLYSAVVFDSPGALCFRDF
jgi:hypothetical protein